MILPVDQNIQKGAEKVKEVIKEDVWSRIKDFLDLGITFSHGKDPINITIGGVLLVVIVILATTAILRFIRGFITRNMERENELKFISIFKFVRYTVYMTVILLTLSASGIDITVLITASTVLFVGLGLALQELFQDLIGGIAIMLDKSLSVGDVIELEHRVSRVVAIKLRTTRSLTSDDKILIIPNHKFIGETVYNYTQNHKTTRETVKVHVAFGSDTALVKKILLDCAARQNEALKSPAPFVFLRILRRARCFLASIFLLTIVSPVLA